MAKRNLKKVLEYVPEVSTYQATDDDLPSVFWTDEEFWNNAQKEAKNEPLRKVVESSNC